MKCLACDVKLTDYEATRKDSAGGYIDLCNVCLRSTKHEEAVISRSDLESEADIEDIVGLTLDRLNTDQ